MAAWEEIEPLLTELLDLDDTACADRLDSIQATNPELAAELRDLLVAAEQTRWEQQLAGAAAQEVVQALNQEIEQAQDLTNTRIGRYQTRSLLGRGGMGAVYLAERADGAFEQTVALKVLPGRSLSSAAGERFLVERQILAQLEHPNIARLLDGGLTDDGSPYFVMEYVAGSNITQYCQNKQLKLAERLALFEELTEAVTFAHAQLVVHGDIKPDNVLVSATGSVKLLDFGIATVLDRTRLGASASGGLTPNYASPEQLQGQPLSALSDLYSLGVLLYVLLTGKLPRNIAGSTTAGRVPQTYETPYLPASSRASVTGVTTELDLVVNKALATDPQDRYGAVADLQADLRRFRDHLPLLAHKPSRRYALAKFVRRHPLGVSVSGLLLASIVAGVVGTTLQAQRAEQQAQRAERVSDFLQSVFDAANPFGAWKAEKSVRDLLQYADVRYQQDLADDPAALADMQNMLGVAYLGNGEYDRSVELLNASLLARQAVSEADPLPVAEVHNNLANALIENGQYAEAAEHAQQALVIYEQHEGRQTAVAADALINLAVATSRLGDPAQAQRLHEEALSIREAVLAPGDVAIADSKTSLAAVQAAQGNHSQVLPLNREAYDSYSAVFGPEHPRSVRAMNGIASGEFLAGNLEAAAAAFEILLQQAEARLGPEHPELALVLNNLGRVRTELGQFDQALALLERATPLVARVATQKMLGIGVGYNRAVVLSELGQFAAAALQLEQARKDFVALVGETHPLVRRTDTQVATNTLLSGEVDTARGLFEQLAQASPGGPGASRWLALAQLGAARCDVAAQRYPAAAAMLDGVIPELLPSLPEAGWRKTELQLLAAIANAEVSNQRALATQLIGQLSTDSVRSQRARVLMAALGAETDRGEQQ